MIHLVYPLSLPSLFFWGILLLGRDELGFRKFVFWACLWAGLLVFCSLLGICPHVFIAIQALMAVVLLLVVFGGDIQIR